MISILVVVRFGSSCICKAPATLLKYICSLLYQVSRLLTLGFFIGGNNGRLHEHKILKIASSVYAAAWIYIDSKRIRKNTAVVS